MSLQDEEMRVVYASTVEQLWREHPDQIYALEADLATSMSTSRLAPIMGSHFIDVGIMEAHMIGTAAGISLAGGYAFAHSFGQFITRRAFDQVFVSLAYSRLNACLVGSDAGVSAEHNGGTHMSFEDLGLMRIIPDTHVYDVCDPVEFAAVLRMAADRGGLTYVRTIRKLAPRAIHSPTTDFGTKGAIVVREGNDVTILACGIEVDQALTAAELLASEGISAEVVDVFRTKPLDDHAILSSVARTGRVVTAENHNVINGLGSAVAELLSENLPTPLRRIGVRERFGQVGRTDYLLADYGMDATAIAAACRDLVEDAHRPSA